MLINDDCLNVIKQIERKSIDAIITDPPYMSTDLHFDKMGFNIKEWVDLCLPILKDDGYLISFGSIPLLGEISSLIPLRWSGWWLKSGPVMRTHTAKKPMSLGEPYAVYAHPNHKIKNLVFNKLLIPGEPYKKVQRKTGFLRGGKDSLSRINTSAWTTEGFVKVNEGTRQQTDVIAGHSKNRMKHAERTAHPTQKPVSVLSTLILMCTNPGQKVLDPFAGSGSTAIACIDNDREYICIEKDKEYFQIMEDRVNNYKESKGEKLYKEYKEYKDYKDYQLSLF